MKQKVLLGIVILLIAGAVVSIYTARWNSGSYPVWLRYIPEIRICHLGGIPPANGVHCHWFWEAPHAHPV